MCPAAPCGERNGTMGVVQDQKGTIVVVDDEPNIADLAAGVKGVLRRVDGGPAPEVMQCGEVAIDAGRREVRVAGAPVEFTTKEFDLLRHLAERPGLALSRQQILDGVWGYDWYGDARTVDVHIAQVRKKLGDAVEITTVRGVGYRLES